jgi:hypothetical protein
MDYRTFKHVLDMTEHGMQRHYLQSERAGGYVSPEAQLAFTIRWLAGGSYLDIADHYDVSKATFYRLVYECIDLIIDAFPISFPLSSEDALGSLAADFVAKQSKTIFMRVVGAIDGILVKIRCPSAHECHGAQNYWCRKSYFALNVQAVADTRSRFIFVSFDNPGATHDAKAWSFSALACAIAGGGLLQGFYLLGDAAYRGCRQILTPFVGSRITATESIFSFYHSSLRMVVECAFGMLVNRWAILQRPLKVPLKKAPRIIECCMCLHNVLVDGMSPLSPPMRVGARRNDRDSLAGFEYDYRNMLNTRGLRRNSGDTTSMTALRRKLKNRMRVLGMKRPAVKMDTFRIMHAAKLW